MNEEEVAQAIRHGRFVAVSDSQDRENETDLVIDAHVLTVEQMAFMIRHTSGIICVVMGQERLRQLGLERLRTDNPANFDTPFVMPVDFKPGTRGGVSAQERVATIQALIDPRTRPKDLGRPGHVFPLQVHEEGLHGRRGHTEAAYTLMERFGQPTPTAVIGELMNEDGTMMRGDALQYFLQQYHIPHLTINELSD